MDSRDHIKLEQIDANRWRIPKGSIPAMRVDGVVFTSSEMLAEVVSGGALLQVANVATLPG
ncbi:MAG: RNA-splicing ligase RtcB, partial [Planctomycetes bacterium]|nr:RNA-splicing ligase RtcB [Planctomycetota bacterium]